MQKMRDVTIELTLSQARRIAVNAQLLSAPRPKSVLETVQGLGSVQIDPTSAVARAEHLVLWSRLGRYDVGELDRLVEAGELFEYRAFIYPRTAYPVYREAMRRAFDGEAKWATYARDWMAANAALRRHVLTSLRRNGPLQTSDFEDRAVLGWRPGGWNEGKNVSRMLELLFAQGKVAIAGRDGTDRLWDLGERVFPAAEARLSRAELTRRVVEERVRQQGIVRPTWLGYLVYHRLPGWKKALGDLVREGRVVPARVEGVRGEWYVHAPVVGASFRPRTTLLCPFDKLIADRDRAEQLFGFRYRIEIYVPKARREYGYYVLPILHGDRLVGRIDPLFDRKSGVLRVNAIHWEADAPDDVPLERCVKSLADWIGAAEIAWP